MHDDEMKWLLKGKIVRDFRGFPLGRVKQVWFDHGSGPMVVVERGATETRPLTWEAIPLREVDTVEDFIRLKPPIFAE
jgi:sporulation protein YlmC with PRC-barrel domain